ncbi:39S ribosomal protein L18, mitochondrial [Vespa crabro]|uniref:39S ribosomal protein L18, mitochondrial n=1 Tax=Vespa crabro TaxID=7445 RepID=UPI001F0176B6|nr:39S ribosomal protein L18, mitochondrial [Vespa crabro]XP_046819992.1 39S ribosomal protein L18, mitochondrial [Vespa crabro]
MFTKNLHLCLVNSIFKREIHGNVSLIDNCIEVRNRNPRNLERLLIARKPQGYHLEKQFRNFWHKLEILPSQRHVTVRIVHFKNGPVITASSNEWALKKLLYRKYDSMAYVALGQVLAQRCLESGICEIYHNESITNKISLLLKELEKNNIILHESDRYIHPFPWSLFRPEKPWETHE